MATQFVDLKPSPPVCLVHYTSAEVNLEEVHHMVKELQFVHGLWMDNKKFSVERCLLSKVVRRSQNQFRAEKFHSNMKKIERAIKRLDIVNIPALLDKIISMCPRLLDLEDEISEFQLPSHQMFQFLLHRTSKTSELLKYTLDICMDTFIFMSQYVSMGFFWYQLPIYLANISSIWYILRAYLRSLLDLYKKIFTFIRILKPTGVPWLQEGEIQASSLDHLWLPVSLKKRKMTFTERILAQSKEAHNSNQEVEEEKKSAEDKRQKSDAPLVNAFAEIGMESEDTGVALSREEIDKLRGMSKKGDKPLGNETQLMSSGKITGGKKRKSHVEDTDVNLPPKKKKKKGMKIQESREETSFVLRDQLSGTTVSPGKKSKLKKKKLNRQEMCDSLQVEVNLPESLSAHMDTSCSGETPGVKSKKKMQGSNGRAREEARNLPTLAERKSQKSKASLREKKKKKVKQLEAASQADHFQSTESTLTQMPLNKKPLSKKKKKKGSQASAGVLSSEDALKAMIIGKKST